MHHDSSYPDDDIISRFSKNVLSFLQIQEIYPPMVEKKEAVQTAHRRTVPQEDFFLCGSLEDPSSRM